MSFLRSIFKKPLWSLGKTQSNELLHDFAQYLTYYYAKVSAFQEVELKRIDFVNQHFFEKNEKRFESSGKARGRSPKLYDIYFRYIKKRLKNIQKLLERSFIKETHMHRLLEALESEEELFDAQQLVRVKYYADNYESLLAHLHQQSTILDELLERYKLFIGNEQTWEQDLGWNSTEARTPKQKAHVLREKERLLGEWRWVLERFNDLKTSFRSEARLAFDQVLGEDVASWKHTLSTNLHRQGMLQEIQTLVKQNERLASIAKEEKVKLFHATEDRRNTLPLKETRFGRGFFVCEGKREYAMKIKQDQGLVAGQNLYSISWEVPKSVFVKLFITDKHAGREQDPLSMEAYEHAYYLPVSRYPLFNHYYFLGLISLG